MSLFLAPDKVGRFPVSLITGFLGSGKTTLLNRLLRHPAMAGTAVVINEFGDVALDQHFVEKTDGEVVVMANGCLCCSLNGDLEGIVGTLFAKREAGEVPEFERLLVETTGLADPAPIMQLLLNSPLIERSFRLDAVVATVDAVHGERALDEHEEAVKQAAIADRIVLTKTDLAPPDAVERLMARLADLNPGAPVYRVVMGDIDPELLFGAGDAAVRDPVRWLGPIAHLHHHGRDEVTSFCLTAMAPLDWREFQRWLTRIKLREADRLLRVKGLIAVAGEDGPVVIHGVHHVFHPPVRLARWPDEDRSTRIVFITRGLDRAKVEKEWRAFVEGLVVSVRPE
jgi:G3E family GTPase